MNFYSNGKLLLTGEYLVMLGAKAIAFPVKYGQDLQVSILHDKVNLLHWKANELGKEWLDVEMNLSSFSIVQTSSIVKAQYLSNILKAAKALKPDFLNSEESIFVETNTNFPINWGLGTSSTLINNIAKWVGVDPFELHGLVSKGSGYDIACAESNKPILFQKLSDGNVSVEEIDFKKKFLDNIYFVYSGKKKNTEDHITKFVNRKADYTNEIQEINNISQELIEVTTLDGFIALLTRHEQIIGKVIQETPIAEKSFAGFKGVIKSLGAWGGDFILAASRENFDYVKAYFEQFGLSVILPFKDVVFMRKGSFGE